MKDHRRNPIAVLRFYAMGRELCAIVAGVAWLAAANGLGFAQEKLHEAEERVIRYDSSSDLADPIAKLQKRLTEGSAKLTFETNRGYLSSVLAALKVPESSQVLVFSKTSSQRAHTSPGTPRALYFADEVSVAWVPGAPEIDLTAIDPTRGPIFYTLAQDPASLPKFTRSSECMQCHIGPRTLFVPGLLVRSFYTASNGTPLGAVSEFINGHNSPLKTRWGGWYVTGSSIEAHLGNLFALASTGRTPFEPPAVSNKAVNDLRDRLDTSRYLSPHSDIVALLVLEHEVRMQNLITRANYETRYANDPVMAASGTPEWRQQRIVLAGEMLIEYMLFRNEAALNGPVQGTSGFEKEFPREGPRDSKGRSLRQLDLNRRLLRYPCSFLVYSPAFDALPIEMRNFLWRRLNQILSGRDHTQTYAGMAEQDRKDVFEILTETKPEFFSWLEKHKTRDDN